MAALPFTFARAYQHSFASHPHLTLAVSGGCLNALGDAVAQFAQNSWEQDDKHDFYDFARTFRFFCFGFTISPLMGRWNTFLERRFPLRTLRYSSGSGSISFKALSKRVACDQLVMAPVGLALFLGSMSVMEGRSMPQICEKYRDLYATVLLANWKVWPLAQFVNFRYMPLPYRVPFAHTYGVAWTLYLSLLNAEEDCLQDKRAAQNAEKS